jgi:Flp pilus assembly protein TadG
MRMRSLSAWWRGHRGVTVVFVALALVALLSFAALAVDLGYIYVVKNELQNAADSAALAGAQVLYNDAGTSVNAGANDVALQYAHSHQSEKVTVDVESVERGHWNFFDHQGLPARTFTPNDSLAPVALWDVTTDELDANTDFINAVRVITVRRSNTAAIPQHFFARVFGAAPAQIRTTAVGYIGFAGTLRPEEAEQPVAICQESIRDQNGDYTCGVGRMINSGGNVGHNTGGWTNFSQPCDTANTPSVRPLVCGDGNPLPISLGQGMGSVGGQLQTVADDLRDCWTGVAGIDVSPADGWPEQPWSLTLPVVECPGNNVSPCSRVVGAVTLNIVWITRNDKNQMNEVPRKMADWPGADDGVTIDANGKCSASSVACWNSFVSHFNLQDILNNSPVIYEDKTIYFLPDCSPHVPAGITGGANFGILAKIPVLVR